MDLFVGVNMALYGKIDKSNGYIYQTLPHEFPENVKDKKKYNYRKLPEGSLATGTFKNKKYYPPEISDYEKDKGSSWEWATNKYISSGLPEKLKWQRLIRLPRGISKMDTPDWKKIISAWKEAK